MYLVRPSLRIKLICFYVVKDLKNPKFMYTDRVVNRLKKRPKKQSFLIFSEKDRFVFGITYELLIHLSKVIGQTFYFCQMSQEFYFIQIEN